MADEKIADPVEETPVEDTKDRKSSSVHFGDADFNVDEDVMDATWAEVCSTCCTHSADEWGMIAVGLVGICIFLYFFLFGLDILGDGAKVMSGCKAGELFGDDTNPVAGLMIGILATVLLQSSSTTTSIVVSLVGSAVSVSQGIYMIMGANIGTSVTNTIVAMGQMGDGDQLERAFAGATVHDMFNFLSVAILLPIEVITGYLDALTGALVKGVDREKGDKWEGPVKKLVDPLGQKVIKSNSSLIKNIAKNKASCEPGDGHYPIICDGPATYKSCSQVGLISCVKKSGDCPLFFNADASASDDKVSGGVVFFLGIGIMFICLLGLVTILQKLLLGMSTRIIYKATDVNGYIAIAIGAGVTMLVQSSSITTSVLTPFVGMGALRLEQMLPLTLGANIGTTMTAIMAALVTTGTDSLQVALAHLFFNISGIAIWYPLPIMRNVPLYAARRLGRATRLWRGFPLVYIGVMFFLVPLTFLGISFLFTEDNKAMAVLGAFIVICLAAALAYAAYWINFQGGRESMVECFQTRERKRVAVASLPDDMDYLKAKMAELIEHTGISKEVNEENEEEAPAPAEEEVVDA